MGTFPPHTPPHEEGREMVIVVMGHGLGLRAGLKFHIYGSVYV